MAVVVEFFSMGGYALFVWTAYGVTAVGLFVMLIHGRIKLKKVKREIGELETYGFKRTNSTKNDNI